MNPPPAAVSAVTVVPVPGPAAGTGKRTTVQARPPSADTSANDRLAPDAVKSVPAATMTAPFAAT